MAFKEFSVGPSKGLLQAALDDVPNLLVVVGPNGAGKSTMLYELQRAKHLAEPETRILYINPNRPWKRVNFGLGVVSNLNYSLSDLYAAESFPGWQLYQPSGFVASGLPRNADNVDDAQGLVKFAFARLEQKRQVALVAGVDANPDARPDPLIVDAFAPLKEMVNSLLPHLRFKRVDVADAQNLRVVIEKLDGDSPVELDVDELSSGEKAVFQLFMPFIETQVEDRIERRTQNARSIVAIIDEPELHLHPALQVGLMTYLRHLTTTHHIQFIIATHSTTIMDVCDEDELYLLAPPATVSGQNQLMKLSSSTERLDAVRALTGSTYAVTRCRPIVFVEGEPSGSKDITDQRLLETLLPEARGWVIVPSKGRAETLKSATTLRDPTLTALPGIPVFALVDQDTGGELSEDYLLTWPVCMIENLLLDPRAIWEVLEPLRDKLALTSADDVRRALDEIAMSRVERETALRFRRQTKTFRFTSSLDPAAEVVSLADEVNAAVLAHLAGFGSADELKLAEEAIRTEVARIVSDGKHLELFHGKEILKEFYEEHAKASGFSKVTFCYSVANAARDGERLKELVAIPARKIRQFTPAGLVEALAAIADAAPDADDEMAGLQTIVNERRSAWVDGRESGAGAELRQRLSSVAQALTAGGHVELAENLRRETAVMGVD